MKSYKLYICERFSMFITQTSVELFCRGVRSNLRLFSYFGTCFCWLEINFKYHDYLFFFWTIWHVCFFTVNKIGHNYHLKESITFHPIISQENDTWNYDLEYQNLTIYLKKIFESNCFGLWNLVGLENWFKNYHLFMRKVIHFLSPLKVIPWHLSKLNNDVKSKVFLWTPRP